MAYKKEGKQKTKKKLVLIDANAIIHRAFHALPPLTSPIGEPTNAVYGFTAILLRIFREIKPDFVVAAFDTAKPTFRHAAYQQYKATRVKAPDELYVQIPRVKEMLSAFGIPALEREGFEADDIIGTVAAKVGDESPDAEVIIVTGDMDTLQLVDDRVKVWTMRKDVADTVLYDIGAVKKRFGIAPKSLPDYKGLRGDPSDNIIGVRGIGEKTASEILAKHPHLEEVYAALKKGILPFSEGVKKKLTDGKEDAFFSRMLAAIRCDVPISFRLEALSLAGGGKNYAAEKLFQELGFFSLLKRLHEITNNGFGGEKQMQPQLELIAVKTSAGFSDFQQTFSNQPPKAAALFFDDRAKRLSALFNEGALFSLSIAECQTAQFRAFLKSETLKYIFDAKPLYKALLSDKNIKGELTDLLIAAYLLDPGRSRYSFEDICGRFKMSFSFQNRDEYLRALLDAGEKTVRLLRDENLFEVFAGIELPLTPVLAEMEENGIRLDPSVLAGITETVDAEIRALTLAIHQEAGGEFNIASPSQVAEALFSKLGVSAKGLRKTGKGRVSTKFSELTKLAGRHPIVEKILRHRELSKLKTTYLDSLPSFLGKDGRLHTTFNQVRTETGRLASENPNMQNIPIKTEIGRDIRRAFTADHGWTLASFDYSQVELRVAADLAGDEKMIDAFRQGLDIHALTAAEINNVPLDKVTPDLRRKAKALNFGVLYGMGARGFADQAGVSVEEAQTFIDEYFSDFRGIAEFIEHTKEFARERGFVKTAFGRKRYLPGINSGHPMIRAEAERMAVNMPIQGTATGDIMKKAMIEVHRLFSGMSASRASRSRILLQIHDELICEIPDDDVAALASKVRDVMESVWKGRVALKVDAKKGKHWAELS